MLKRLSGFDKPLVPLYCFLATLALFGIQLYLHVLVLSGADVVYFDGFNLVFILSLIACGAGSLTTIILAGRGLHRSARRGYGAVNFGILVLTIAGSLTYLGFLLLPLG